MASSEDRRLAYLDAMGIQSWMRRAVPGETTAATASPVVGTEATTCDVSHLDWETLCARALVCTSCALSAGRTQVVFGVGNTRAQWMIVGEAPGAEEDKQGEPFVGRAGKLLDAMIEAIGYKRAEVYIANIVKCRPPGNRDPKPEEAAACAPYLQRQIELVQPRIILAVGRIAAQNLLKTDAAVSSLRGRRWRYDDTDIPVVVTYHPAYLLRSPKEKPKAWQDLQYAWRIAQSADKS